MIRKLFLKYRIADQMEKKHTDKHQCKKRPRQMQNSQKKIKKFGEDLKKKVPP